MQRFLSLLACFTSLASSLHAYDLPVLPPIPAIPAPQAAGSVAMGDPALFPEVQMDFPIAAGAFGPTWSSISSNLPVDSSMLRQKKFGIWVHYGPQAAGQSGDWYAQHMYQQGSTPYNNHLAGFGHPTVKGYKDFLNEWNPSALDPAALTQIYHNAGARFLLVQGVHHDNFDNWNSRYNPWNAKNLGPRRDTMAEWRDSCRSKGMGFGVAFHHEYSWWFFQPAFLSDTSGALAGQPYDAVTSTNGTGTWWENYDPRLLYNINLHEYAGITTPNQGYWNPTQGIFTNHLDYSHWYANWWALRILDIIENYDPDFIYTDGTSTQPFSGYGTGTGYKCNAMQRVIAHMENRAVERHGLADRFAAVKFHSGDRLTTTFESNYPANIKTDQPWIGEVPVGDWFYNTGFNYDPGMVIRYLLECVSRDGASAICISLKPDGSLDPGSVTQLAAVGNWMNINSAGIYGSRAWSQYGEGSNKLPTGALGNNQANKTFTNSDFRYTVGADGFLYAYCMTVPSAGATVALTALGTDDGTLAAPVTSVELLGSAGPLTWSQSATALNITCPASMPFQTSVCFKIGPAAIIKTTAPANLTSSSSGGSITLGWTSVDQVATFTVKRATSSTGTYTDLATGLTGMTYVDSTAVANTPYYYVVTATKDGNTSLNSAYVVGLVSSASTWQSQDIGSVGAAGSHAESASYHVVKGSGADVWGTSDQFQYVYQPLAGNGSITAKVESMQSTGNWAKAGVMIRESLNTNSKYAIAYLSPVNGTALQQRATTGGTATGISNITGISAPYWLRLTRSGSSIAAFQSTDGITWSNLGTTSITMANDVCIGLAVCSVASSTLNNAVFSNVVIGGPPPPPRVNWQAPATVTSDTDINLGGTLVHAGNFRSSGNVTVTVGAATIPFVNRAASNAFAGLATGEEAKVVSGAGGKQTNAQLFNAAGTTVSTLFESVLDGSAWENTDAGPAPGATDMILRVTGAGGAALLQGHFYQIQLFYSDDRATSSTRGQLFHDGQGNASAAFLASSSSYLIGTFTADATGYQDFHARNTSGEANFPVGISAYVLRKTGLSDVDADGMEDTWETSHFGNLSQTPNGDFDGDGSSNLTEYRLGLDPANGSKGFTATRSTSGLLVWPSSFGVNFTVQRSGTLTDWSNIATVPGTTGTASFTDPSPPAGNTYYRIRLDP